MVKNDLYERLKLVENVMIRCLPEDDLYLHEGYEAAHNIGRWVEAALLLENKVGMVIPPRIEKAMLLHLRAMTSNPYGMLLNDREVLGKGCLNHHNLRECLMSLVMLIRYRGSQWAVHCGERLIDTIDRRFYTGELTEDEMCEKLGLPVNDDPMITRPAEDPFAGEDFTPSTGRAIEGLLAFWKETGSLKAREVLDKMVAFHRVHSLCADGAPPKWLVSTEHVGHNHSYLGTIRGLLLYGLEFQDATLVEAVYRTYQNSFFANNCSFSGWAPHDLGKSRFTNEWGDPLGDHASCADVAYIAFLLATRGAHPELLDDAARLIRGRLFYCQVQSGADRGAWGIYNGHFDKAVVMDVFALIAGTLSILYRNGLEADGNSLWVHLHFSQEHEAGAVTAYRDACQHLNIRLFQPQAVRVWIPGWCDKTTLCVKNSEGRELPYTMENGYLMIPPHETSAETEIRVTFLLPQHETVEYTAFSKRGYRICWRGDEIVNVQSMEMERGD